MSYQSKHRTFLSKMTKLSKNFAGLNKNDLDYLSESQGRTEVYRQHINYLITQLNKTDKKKIKEEIIKCINETDAQYLKAFGREADGKVLFTRHGECGWAGQKRLGLSPNSPISKEASKNMHDAKTNESTGALLLNPNESPRIAISPMTRALQTASLLIPKHTKTEISINPALSENSITPSGLDIRSNADLQNESTNAFFFSIKRILFFFANLIYKQDHFNALDEKRKEALGTIATFHHKPDTFRNEGVPKSLGYDENKKITETKELIKDTTKKDLWLFGHGKNFKGFFKELFGIDSDFKFAETRVVYKINRDNREPILFTPPYTFEINQKTGLIEGTYTGVSKAVINKKAVKKESKKVDEAVKSSPEVMVNGLGSANVVAKSNLDLDSENKHQQPAAEKKPGGGVTPLSPAKAKIGDSDSQEKEKKELDKTTLHNEQPGTYEM